MALINRVSRLLRADLHAVMDRVEEPEVLLRQAVREMDAALAEDGERAKRLERERAQLDARLQDSRDIQARLAEELDVCFEAGQEELARTIVRKRLEQTRLDDAVNRRRAALDEAARELGGRMLENRSRLDAVREKLELLGGDDVPDPTLDDGGPVLAPGISAQDVEVAFLAEKRRRSRS